MGLTKRLISGQYPQPQPNTTFNNSVDNKAIQIVINFRENCDQRISQPDSQFNLIASSLPRICKYIVGIITFRPSESRHWHWLYCCIHVCILSSPEATNAYANGILYVVTQLRSSARVQLSRTLCISQSLALHKQNYAKQRNRKLKLVVILNAFCEN